MTSQTLEKNQTGIVSESIITICVALSLSLFLSLISHSPSDPLQFYFKQEITLNNYLGPLGARLSHKLFLWLGISSYILPAFGLMAGYMVKRKHSLNLNSGQYFAIAMAFITLPGLLYSVRSLLPGDLIPVYFEGVWGNQIGSSLAVFISTTGTLIFYSTLCIINLMIIFQSPLSELINQFKSFLKNSYQKIKPEESEDEEYSFYMLIKELPGILKAQFKKAHLDNEELANEDQSDVDPAQASTAQLKEEVIQSEHKQIKKSVLPPPPPKREKVENTGSNTEENNFKSCIEIPETLTNSAIEASDNRKANSDFILPSFNYLEDNTDEEIKVDNDLLNEKASNLMEVLKNFRIKGEVVKIKPGPIVTLFEVLLETGTKISAVESLAEDIAMGLKVEMVRVAPIPNRGVIGIEIPNENKKIVFLKEVIGTKKFSDGKMALPLGLGHDIEGAPVLVDLAAMPHLLVAGATGMGKSVSINAMICSLLFKLSPKQLRLIMIDPKMLEFNLYNDIPHLLTPVVTDPSQALLSLKWAVTEMDRRYEVLAKKKVRNLKEYNANLADDETEMPYIVIIVDEFADLMMTASKEVEVSIARLAGKARAAGIHLILATQRPSREVVTGLIKSNMPARLALRVAQSRDSSIILDQTGAQSLLGRGDSLFLSPKNATQLIRVHGALVEENEISLVVNHLKEQQAPEYEIDFTQFEESADGSSFGSDAGGDEDPMWEEALNIVANERKASASYLQRALRIGYNRAARIIEMMEARGIVGPASSSGKPRQVLVDPR